METDEAILGIGDSLARIFTGGRRTARAAAAELGPALQPAAWPVFREVVRAERTQASAIVQMLGMDKSAVSRHLKDLRELGLVDAERDAADARVAWLSPTPLGRTRYEAISDAQYARLREVLVSWSPEDVARFALLLARFSGTGSAGTD